MGLIIGPTPWWQLNLVAACPAGTTLLDGSRIICKAGGTAWIVAPSCTQVSSQWASTSCCICEWSALETRLIQCGFNPCDWFVPCYQLLQNPGYVCSTNWDSFSTAGYWSSTEINPTCACLVCYPSGIAGYTGKSAPCCVRAFRCVTY